MPFIQLIPTTDGRGYILRIYDETRGIFINKRLAETHPLMQYLMILELMITKNLRSSKNHLLSA